MRTIYQTILFIFIAIAGNAQVLQPTQGNPTRNGRNNRNDRAITNKEVTVEGEKPPITDYKIISSQRDTTYLDTTLTMAKDYKYNFLRRDDYELMPRPNIGQPYNSLGYTFDWDALTPHMGAKGRHFGYFEIDDVNYYYVPTPLTELFFKTAIEEGQQLDAFFTVNLSRQFNFSVRYKGTRSVGNYVRSDMQTKQFELTINYRTKDQRYRVRAHSTFQNLFNQENGGLTETSLALFRADDDDFENRGRLEPNLDDAGIELDGRRFYMDQDYALIRQVDSTSRNVLRVYNKAWYEDKFFEYDEDDASTSFLGDAYTNRDLKDRTNFEQGHLELGANYDNHILGFYQAGVSRRAYQYGYSRVILNEDETIPAKLNAEVYQFRAAFAKAVYLTKERDSALAKTINVKANAGLNLAGDLDGQFLNASAGFKIPDVDVEAGIRISSRAPDLNFLLWQSDYINYNWRNNYSNTEKQQLYFRARSEKYIDLDVSFTTLQDQTYFTQELITDSDGDVTGFNAVPRQASDPVTYLKVRAHKDIKFGDFGLDNTVQFQAVGQEQEVINVPRLLTRNTIYYKNRFFNDALQVQTGLTFKYFTEYNMNAYDPVLGEFYTQNRTEIGNFPMVDFFLNAKIQQTRIFFKLEHFNSQFTPQDYFSAPRIPYRDFVVRFGLVWNFFL